MTAAASITKTRAANIDAALKAAARRATVAAETRRRTFRRERDKSGVSHQDGDGSTTQLWLAPSRPAKNSRAARPVARNLPSPISASALSLIRDHFPLSWRSSARCPRRRRGSRPATLRGQPASRRGGSAARRPSADSRANPTALRARRLPRHPRPAAACRVTSRRGRH